MKRRRIREAVGQKDLFTGKVVKKPGEFFNTLHKEKLVFATSGGKRVRKAINTAFDSIRQLPGVNRPALIQALKGKGTLDLETVLRTAVLPLKRSPSQEKAIRQAIETIVSIVNKSL